MKKSVAQAKQANAYEILAGGMEALLGGMQALEHRMRRIEALLLTGDAEDVTLFVEPSEQAEAEDPAELAELEATTIPAPKAKAGKK